MTNHANSKLQDHSAALIEELETSLWHAKAAIRRAKELKKDPCEIQKRVKRLRAMIDMCLEEANVVHRLVKNTIERV